MTTVVLACCLGVVALLLDESYRQAVLRGAEDQLRAVANGLLGAAVERGDHLVFAELGEQRLSQPDSGLYAYVDAAGAGVIWRSPTVLVAATGIADEPPIARPAPGESYFGPVQKAGDPRRFVYAYTVVWEALNDMELTFWVLADQHPYLRQLSAFRQDIVVWLGVAAAVFVAIQFAALRWGLAPVRRMADRIRGLESGKRRNIGDDYPRELSGLAGNLNRFIAHERANRDRYRRAMDDLAHSLKTPLAVLKNAVRHDGEHADTGACVLSEQIERMESTVGHQLSRAAAVPAALPLVRVSVMGTAERIVRAVERAYADKPVTTELVTSGLSVRVDERDLMEMLGNLIENAFKYTRSRVRLSVRDVANGVEVWVEDDGDGIAPAQRTAVLERGTRVDTKSPGQGIGLAVVVEIAAAYEGALAIEASDLGGARLRLRLPG
ncbi:MAG: ATP-binding protein [Gammaproteobacteria bacterium]|nr:ATP-binding protein [Gammaproteobacteria bacterium]